MKTLEIILSDEQCDMLNEIAKNTRDCDMQSDGDAENLAQGILDFALQERYDTLKANGVIDAGD